MTIPKLPHSPFLLLLDRTDLRQAYGKGSPPTPQSGTPRNMGARLPSPQTARAAGSRRGGRAGQEPGVQRAPESKPQPQTRWEAAGDWHTALHNTRPGRQGEEGGQLVKGCRLPLTQILIKKKVSQGPYSDTCLLTGTWEVPMMIPPLVRPDKGLVMMPWAHSKKIILIKNLKYQTQVSPLVDKMTTEEGLVGDHVHIFVAFDK